MEHHAQERRLEVGRQRRARTRANIVAAAFDLFGSEEGLFTRIEDIAAKAGVTRATFYNHFSGMAELRAAIAALRAQGETVTCVLPGHESEVDEFHCDRELAREGGQWRVKPL